MTNPRLDVEVVSDTERIIDGMVAAVRDDPDAWFFPLMSAIRQWPVPEETVGGRTYRYLIGGEAFDWLLLAERLCDALGDLVPCDDIEALIFDGRPPVELAEDDWKTLLGAKYKLHLNFVYGVHVESALQLAVRDEVLKEHHSRVWHNGHADDEAFAHTYGKARTELLAEFWRDIGHEPADEVSLADLNEFTYWLFRYRVKNADPARVASDTRKGTVKLAHLQALRSRRWREPD
jgi:hypothetical protein